MKFSRDLIRVFLLLIFSICLGVNALYFESPVIGVPVSLAFFSVVSVTVGEVFFSGEEKFFKVTLGFAAFSVLIALFGSALIVLAKFSEIWSLIMVTVTGLVFSVLSLRIKGTSKQEGCSGVEGREGREGLGLLLGVGGFLVFTVVAFYALVMARTGEGGASVWLTISDYFLPSFFFASLFLVLVLFFTRAHVGLKLSLIFVYSFLARSLFWIVWYPGRYGDPWTHLGRSRFIDRTGMPYAYSYMLQNFMIIELIGSEAQYALVVLLRRMLSVDIYWVHILFVPFLWSFLMPLFSYKLAEMLAKRRSEQFPLIAAVAASLFPSVVLWGTVSVANSVGFIFFFFAVFLLFYWVRTGERRIWFLSLLTTMAAFVAHMQPGIFAFMFFLLMTVFQKTSRNILKVIFYLLLFVSYPFALYLAKASFSLDMLFTVVSFGALQSDIVTVMVFLGLVGVILSGWGWYVNRRSALLVFVFYVTVVAEYYLSMYGMSNLPFGPGRILVMANLLLLPFVALGIIGLVDVVAKALSYVRLSPAFLKKFVVGFSPRLASFVLICLALSAQATLVLHQAYPHYEIVDIQPTAYEMEAIYYVDSTAPGQYVVMCDPQLASLAIGLLGIDHGYAGGGGAVWGIPYFTYPTIQMYSEMVRSPSLSVMERALAFQEWVEVVYFVLSVKAGASFEEALEQTSAMLPVDAVFGDGKLYVFKYPLPIVEGVGPNVTVVFDDVVASQVQTTYRYMFESDVNYMIQLSGYSSYNITDYPVHWIFSELTVDGGSRSLDESSDINEFIFVSGLSSSNVLNVTWKANDYYPNVGWKELSFKSGWQAHPRYQGTIKPNITSDGNILVMSWNFTAGPYQYYYYVKPANVSTDDYQYVIVRWKSGGPIAVIYVYFELGGEYIVPLGSQSFGWTTTIVQLPPGRNVTFVMVGITNLKNMKIAGFQALYVDYILISS